MFFVLSFGAKMAQKIVQEFVLEIIKDASFYEYVKTKRGREKRFRYREESVFFKLRRRTLKGIQKEIDSVLKEQAGSIVDWKIYTSFPFK